MTTHTPNGTALTTALTTVLTTVQPSQPAGKPQIVARVRYEVVGTGFDP